MLVGLWGSLQVPTSFCQICRFIMQSSNVMLFHCAVQYRESVCCRAK